MHHYRKNPPKRPVTGLRFADILKAAGPLPPLPDEINWSSGITDWGIDGNDDAGDCVEANAAHVDLLCSTAAGSPVSITADQVIAAYTAATGYNPTTGANDNGTDIATFLAQWQSPGYFGSQISGFAQVDPTNLDHFKRAIAELGFLVLGVRLPKSAEDQFAAGQPWTPNPFGFIVGGHCVPAISYGSGGFQVVTWGKLQPVDWGFIAPHVDEAYACVNPLFLRASGVSPSGLTLAAMIGQLSAVAA